MQQRQVWESDKQAKVYEVLQRRVSESGAHVSEEPREVQKPGERGIFSTNEKVSLYIKEESDRKMDM